MYAGLSHLSIKNIKIHFVVKIKNLVWYFLCDFQVVTLAVYSFFATSIMGRQWIDKPVTEGAAGGRYKIDLYFPIFTMLQVNFKYFLIIGISFFELAYA